MKKSSKYLLIIGGILSAVGVVTMGISIVAGASTGVVIGGNGIQVAETKVMDMGKEETIQDQKVLESFESLYVDAGVSEIRLVPSDHYGMEYQLNRSDGELSCEVKDGALHVTQGSNGGIHFNLDLFGWMNRQKTYLAIYYPEGTQFNTVQVENSLGELTVKDIKAKTADFSLDLGYGVYENIEAEKLTIHHDSGSLNISNGTVGSLEIQCELGEAQLSGITANQMNFQGDLGSLSIGSSLLRQSEISCSMGEVDIQGLESDGLQIEADNGSVVVEGTLRGRTGIDAEMGSIHVTTTLGKNEYNYDVHCEMGEIYMNGEKQGGLTFDTGAENDLDLQADLGSIHINVKE